MAKTKKKSNVRQKEVLDNEVISYIYAFVLITFSLVGIMEVGFIGRFLTNCARFLFGSFFGIFFALLIIYAILLVSKKDIHEIYSKYSLAIGCIIVAWILGASLQLDRIGFDVIKDFFNNALDIFNNKIPTTNGLIGSLLYSITSFLFGHSGTIVVIVMLIIFASILLINKSFVEKIQSLFSKILSPLKNIRKKDSNEDYVIEVDEEEQIEEYIGPREIDENELNEIISKNNTYDNDTVMNQSGVFINVDDVFYDPSKQSEANDASNEKTIISAIENYENYRLPRFNLLEEPLKKAKSNINNNAAINSGDRLIKILAQFGINAKIIDIHIGPSVTKFEVKPEMGVRVNKILSLQHDIKMELEAKDIRIEAPIPGKAAIGIEIPNVENTLVNMKDLIRKVPEKFNKEKLLVALGKDLMGENIYCLLNKMPHLLIAGATGSGKSVCMNSIITSLLMRSKPDEVKMLLIDPKKVEFTPFHNVPHLLGPVISDATEASNALKVIVKIMDERYNLFSSAGVRNIESFNQYIDNNPKETIKKLPWIVVIIDELADLMLVAAKDVEASIQRITQLARAAGIHLIVATQRPSVDVITGVIKANIPSRIAFAVSSAIDSRTILDQQGADKLLGNGDMLYIPSGDSVVTRLQGAYVSDKEVNAIAKFVSNQARPKFDDAFIRLKLEESRVSGLSGNDFKDNLYDEVKEFVISSQKASTSFIQRKFSIGYSRAARLIDMLEEEGIVGASCGSKPREVLIKSIEES